MSEELVQQQLWLGTVVVLGSAVAAGALFTQAWQERFHLEMLSTIARKSDVAYEGCRAGSRDAGDAELRSWPGAIADDAETNAKLAEEKATAVAAKKKERSELRGELKKRQSKYEKEYAENSQKLIDPMQSRVQMGSSALQESGTVHVWCALHVCHRSQAQET